MLLWHHGVTMDTTGQDGEGRAKPARRWLNIAMSRSLKDRIKRRARLNGKNASEWARQTLAAAVDQDEDSAA